MIKLETGSMNMMMCSIHNVSSIAYDGFDYAMIHQDHASITRLDEELCVLDTQRGAHCYSCLCSCTQNCCYYAFAPDHPNLLYKLDLNFNEIGNIKIGCHNDEELCNLSMHPTCPLLLLLYPNEIIYLDMTTGEVINTICIHQNRHVHDLIAIHDGYILSYSEQGQTYIEVHCSNCDENQEYCVPTGYLLEAMVLMDIKCSSTTTYHIQLILTNCETLEQVSSILYIDCNQEQPNPNPNPNPINITCEQGKTEIIHSIALEEAGIAHILNAEGEKLQKAVASDTTIEELLLINESVRKTIAQITILEGQLCSKLESLHCLCDDEYDDTCDEK